MKGQTECIGITTLLVSSPDCLPPMSCLISCTAFQAIAFQRPSPTVNILWALLNLVIGYVLFRVGEVFSGDIVTLVVFFAGIAILSILSSVRFAQKHSN